MRKRQIPYRETRRGGRRQTLHRYLAEKALGRLLEGYHPVHHHRDNTLVIGENNDYHKLLHLRTEAYFACGNPHYRKCKCCKCFDDVQNLTVTANSGRKANGDRYILYVHKACINNRRRELCRERGYWV